MKRLGKVTFLFVLLMVAAVFVGAQVALAELDVRTIPDLPKSYLEQMFGKPYPPKALQDMKPSNLEGEFEYIGWTDWKNMDTKTMSTQDILTFVLAKEYLRLHPKVKITFRSIPQGEQPKYIRARIPLGALPGVVAWSPSDEDKEFFYSWELDLLEKNPYSDHAWTEDFPYRGLAAWRASRGGDFDLHTPSPGAYGILVNVDILKKVGIQPPSSPKPWIEDITWDDFIEMARKVKAGGYIPIFHEYGQGGIGSPVASLHDAVWRAKMKQIDLDKNGFVSPYEYVRAIRLGLYSGDDPRNLEVAKLTKELASFFQPNWTVRPVKNFFRLGEAAFWPAGTWVIDQFVHDPERKFDYTSMVHWPRLTKDSTPFGTGMKMHVYNPYFGYPFAVLSKTMESPKMKAVIKDFFQFITAETVVKPYLQGPGVSLRLPYPGDDINKVYADNPEFLKKLNAFLTVPLDTDRPLGVFSPWLSTPVWQEWTTGVAEYSLGKISLATLADRLDAIYEKAAKDMTRDNNWKF